MLQNPGGGDRWFVSRGNRVSLEFLPMPQRPVSLSSVVVVVLRAFRSPAWALTYKTTTRGAVQMVYCTPTYVRTHLTDSPLALDLASLHM